MRAIVLRMSSGLPTIAMSLNFRINSKNGVRGSHSYCEKRHSSSTEIGLEAVRVAGLPSRWIDIRRLRCMAAHTNGHQVGFCSTHQDSAYCHVRSYTASDQTRCDCTLWETGSRSRKALRGPFLAAMTVLESGLWGETKLLKSCLGFLGVQDRSVHRRLVRINPSLLTAIPDPDEADSSCSGEACSCSG